MRASVVIPHWNNRELLEVCLPALRRQTFRDAEVVLVDGASSDDSVAWVRANHPEVRIVALLENRGFVGNVNAGIGATDTEIIALLNNDTEVEPTWLEALVWALDEHPEAGMAASKILLFDRRDHLHSAGDFLGLDGIPGNRGVWRPDDGRYDADVWVFGACGGAAAYRRSMLDDIGQLDEDFVMYCEDVDLNLRACLAGYRCVFAPDARVYHRVSATGGGAHASYYCGRNFIAVVAKGFPGPLLRRHWRRILGAQVRIAWDALKNIRGDAARARLRGQLAGVLALPRFITKRRAVQRRRRVSVDDLEALLTRGDAAGRPAT